MARSTTRSSGSASSKRSTGGSSSSSTKKSSTSKSTAKKSPAKKSSGSQDESSGNGSSSRRRAPSAESRPAARAAQVAAQAARELLELTGKDPEGITGLERTEDGWNVQVEVVEVRRIPDTTDVLALYEVNTDSHGAMQGYRRLKRYARGVPGDD